MVQALDPLQQALVSQDIFILIPVCSPHSQYWEPGYSHRSAMFSLWLPCIKHSMSNKQFQMVLVFCA